MKTQKITVTYFLFLFTYCFKILISTIFRIISSYSKEKKNLRVLINNLFLDIQIKSENSTKKNLKQDKIQKGYQVIHYVQKTLITIIIIIIKILLFNLSKRN